MKSVVKPLALCAVLLAAAALGGCYYPYGGYGYYGGGYYQGYPGYVARPAPYPYYR